LGFKDIAIFVENCGKSLHRYCDYNFKPQFANVHMSVQLVMRVKKKFRSLRIPLSEDLLPSIWRREVGNLAKWRGRTKRQTQSPSSPVRQRSTAVPGPKNAIIPFMYCLQLTTKLNDKNTVGWLSTWAKNFKLNCDSKEPASSLVTVFSKLSSVKMSKL
jgi:hypothetical protein